MTTGPVDIALVRMPYSDISQPSLGLGLLKACCDRLDLSSRVLSANLWFAEEIGPAIHDLIFEAYSTTLVGEWTFAGSLFPDYHPTDEDYLRKVTGIFQLDASYEWRFLHERFPYLDYVTLLREIRRRAPDFIERVADRVLALEPRIVGCSSTFQQHCASLALLRAIKRRRPDVITMIGGANCEGDMGRATFEQFPWLDFVVSGEADGFFGPLCDSVLRLGVDAVIPTLPAGVWGPHQRMVDAEGRPAPALREPRESLVDGVPIARLEDMNDSPIPNYDDYFFGLKETRALGTYLRPALPFQTARGCWWGEKTHCSFCGISRTAMKFRAKSGDNVMEQMLTLRDRYKITSFQGTEYIFDYRFFNTLLPRLKELDSHFRFEVKANLKVEQLEAFVASGTIEVQPGVESLQDDVLGLLKKGTTALQNVKLLKRGRKVGLLIYWNLLHTVPGDRDEWYGEMADIVPLLTHLQPPAAFAQIHYDRFSPYWKEPAKHGLTLQPAFGYELVYPFPREVLADMAYFFETPRQRDGFLKYDPSSHPGLFRLISEVHRWKGAFDSKARPSLFSTDLGDRLTFEDTRAAAVLPAFELDGLDRRVYLAAEDGLYAAPLLKAVQVEGQTVTEEEVEASVQRLIALKVLARLTGRLVSLGIATPVPPYVADTVKKPWAELNPLWGKLKADAALDKQRPNIALDCLRQPETEPLTRWLAGARVGAMRAKPAVEANSQV